MESLIFARVSLTLAPFGFLTSWQEKTIDAPQTATTVFRRSNNPSDDATSNSVASSVMDTQRETRRRQAWNQQFDFGLLADEEEKQAERDRRNDFDEQVRRTEATIIPADESRNRRGRMPSVRILGRSEGRA